ncbi:MAG: HAD family hydrolase [Anaerolineae bacterium]
MAEHGSFGIIWDMDGILVDSNVHHWGAWQRILPEYGLEMTREQFEGTCGMTDADLLPLLYGADMTPERGVKVGEHKEAVFRDLIAHGLEPFPGVRAWLARFSRLGLRQAVASSAPMENIAATLTSLDVWRWFGLVISGVGLAASKPDPAIFMNAAAGLQLGPERCLVIEDSVAGVEAARRAGMACVAVTNTRSAKELAAANLVLATLEDLTEEMAMGLLRRG